MCVCLFVCLFVCMYLICVFMYARNLFVSRCALKVSVREPPTKAVLGRKFAWALVTFFVGTTGRRPSSLACLEQPHSWLHTGLCCSGTGCGSNGKSLQSNPGKYRLRDSTRVFLGLDAPGAGHRPRPSIG